MGWQFIPNLTFSGIFVLAVAIAVISLACIAGLCILLIAWRGKSAGIVLGGLVVTSGLLSLLLLCMMLPRYWWISVLPIYLGILCIRTWRQPPIHGLRIRLSSLLLLVAFVALLFAGLGQRYRQRAIQEPIMQHLLSLPGNCELTQEFDGEMIGLSLSDEAPIDKLQEILSLLNQLPNVRQLHLKGRVTVDHGKQIGTLRRLSTIGLQYVDLDEEVLQEIGNLPNLQTLDLMETNVSDAGLQYLEEAKRLRRLWLDDENFSTQALDRLRKALPDCEI